MDPMEPLTIEMFVEHRDKAEELLSKDSIKSTIPLINNWNSFEWLKDTQLVRFRGLVQNMFDPEIYLESYEIRKSDSVMMRSGKYRDNLKLQSDEMILFESTRNTHAERRPMFVVSIPGLNKWATNIENEQTKLGFREDVFCESRSNTLKRPSDSEDLSNNDTSTINSNPRKKFNISAEGKSTGGNASPNISYFVNSSIVERPGNACLVKFYDDILNISLNDVVELVGFISVDDSLYGSNDQIDDFDVYSMKLPPTMIPRIHVVSHRKLNHLNPLLYGGSEILRWSDDVLKSDCIRLLRTAFTQCLFDDAVAADYLICHLISTVYVRNEETLGQFALNITNIPKLVSHFYTNQLYEIIESCLPASHYFAITIDNLNKTEFVPKKDYTTGRLNSGLLQLAAHTHLILDETRLEPGNLESEGIEAVYHISHLIQKQQMSVDFKFYQIKYDTNIPVLIFSEGKSMFPSNFHVPLKPDINTIQYIQETFAAVKQFLKPKLEDIRCVLTNMRLKDFNMMSENMNMVQDDFVQMRRQYNASADDLHSMMILSRLIGIVEGKEILDEEIWKRAKVMEDERRSRIMAPMN